MFKQSSPTDQNAKSANRPQNPEGHAAVSHTALSKQAKEQAAQRTPAERRKIGRKAAETRREHQAD